MEYFLHFLEDLLESFAEGFSCNYIVIVPQNIYLSPQYYAPTMVACARDFWTLRYSSVLDDGCFVVRLPSLL